MEIVIAIVIGCVVGGLAFLIGTKVGNKLDKLHGRMVESLRQKLYSAPMVIECQLGKPLTEYRMSMDVVGPNLIKIWQHFGMPLEKLPSTSKYAKEMLQWYNPESGYTNLVIVGYLRDGEIRIAWTWQKRDPEWIVTKDALEGLEEYYEDELGNPMLLGNRK